MTDRDTVLAEQRDGCLFLTLNRPDRLNAFNEAMHHALRKHLTTATEDNSIRAVLLTGAGRAFCAGQDLSDRDMRGGGEAPDLGVTLETLYNPLVRQIRALRKPVICAVNGVAAGAGANVALACDIVLAAQSARFIQAFDGQDVITDHHWGRRRQLPIPGIIGNYRSHRAPIHLNPHSRTGRGKTRKHQASTFIIVDGAQLHRRSRQNIGRNSRSLQNPTGTKRVPRAFVRSFLCDCSKLLTLFS